MRRVAVLGAQVISKLVRRKFPKILRLAEPTAQFYEVLAANSIQRIWRGHRVRRKAKRKLAELARASGASPTPSAPVSASPGLDEPAAQQAEPQSSRPSSVVEPTNPARESSPSLEPLNSGKSRLPPLVPLPEPSLQSPALATENGESQGGARKGEAHRAS